MRQSRKLDHIKYSLANPDGPAVNGFEDFRLIHNCLPDLAWDDIDLATAVADIPLSHPVIINAITGGAIDVTDVNARLAELARETNSAMAVGSQYAAIESPSVEHSYKIISAFNPDGTVFANLGAYSTSDQAKRAVDMIGAKAIQIHLNVAQELIMAEGDRNFSGYLRNIAAIVKAVGVPVIVKEVGCGIALEQARQLIDLGIRAIDVGGAGGTNFLAIEAARTNKLLSFDTVNWGIPTAISAVEVASILPGGVDLMVSGGIRTPLEVIKSLVIGGKTVGIAAPALRLIQDHGVQRAVEWLKQLIHGVKQHMLLVGARNISDLARAPVIISGYSREWLTSRGIDITKYALRKKHGI